jgi:hypothetical protein
VKAVGTLNLLVGSAGAGGASTTPGGGGGASGGAMTPGGCGSAPTPESAMSRVFVETLCRCSGALGITLVISLAAGGGDGYLDRRMWMQTLAASPARMRSSPSTVRRRSVEVSRAAGLATRGVGPHDVL